MVGDSCIALLLMLFDLLLFVVSATEQTGLAIHPWYVTVPLDFLVVLPVVFRRKRPVWAAYAALLLGAVHGGRTFRLKAERGEVGERFAVMTQTDRLGGVCKVDLTLKSVSTKEIVARGKGQAASAAQCTKNTHTVRLRPKGDDLLYLSENAESGNPEARMSRLN